MFDGYFVHSRSGNGSGLAADSLAKVTDTTPTGAHIRTDIDVPVFDLQMEGDMTALRSHLTRQPQIRTIAAGRLPVPRMPRHPAGS